MAITEIITYKVNDYETRAKALQVIEGVYLKEKNWISAPDNEIPTNIGESRKYSWFLVTANGKGQNLPRSYRGNPRSPG
jgi:hypothetical protein